MASDDYHQHPTTTRPSRQVQAMPPNPPQASKAFPRPFKGSYTTVRQKLRFVISRLFSVLKSRGFGSDLIPEKIRQCLEICLSGQTESRRVKPNYLRGVCSRWSRWQIKKGPPPSTPLYGIKGGEPLQVLSWSMLQMVSEANKKGPPSLHPS